MMIVLNVRALMLCMIVAVNGLRISSNFDPFHELPGRELPGRIQVPKPKKSQARVAYCLSGQARTLGNPGVQESLLQFLQWQRRTTNHIDVFALLTTTGSGPDDFFHQPQVNASEKLINEFLKKLKAKYSLDQSAGNVNEQNVDQFLIERTCHQKGFWSEGEHLVRSINQLEHMRGCLNIMKDHENTLGFKYDVVVMARPDLLYQTECYLDFEAIMSQDVFTYDHVKKDACSIDWFFAATRHRMMGLFQHPLQCFEEGRLPHSEMVPHTGEAMVDHLLDVHTASKATGTECHIGIQRTTGLNACVGMAQTTPLSTSSNEKKSHGSKKQEHHRSKKT
eukprot:gnl/MRDRNA2_/MRDRNA2_85205_c0_seq1.p1 gnl/MRDRNA2_/MRDRNA2_85205_c0~~gnl/MRDRNA2_/MRDRNA2_85205_c0_seq1.p1  ORF type:complete len:336 (+),score=26.69 gnl/MRDRNA2_/MRDRNA2_85205_c0_seq1:88-1095(+)